MTSHRFALNGPITVSIRSGLGSVEVRAVDAVQEATVDITAAPDDPDGADLISRTVVQLAGATLVVHAPRQGGLADLVTPWRPQYGAVSISVVVPTGTPLRIATTSASVTVSGRCGAADIATGSGRLQLETVDGDLALRHGHADSSVEHVYGAAVVRSGKGNAHLGEVQGSLTSAFGSGRLDVGVARGAVRARAGSGEARFGAVFGDVDVVTGSGRLTIGVPVGVSARLDAITGAGRVHSELPIEDAPAKAHTKISVRARTGSGDVHLARAT